MLATITLDPNQPPNCLGRLSAPVYELLVAKSFRGFDFILQSLEIGLQSLLPCVTCVPDQSGPGYMFHKQSLLDWNGCLVCGVIPAPQHCSWDIIKKLITTCRVTGRCLPHSFQGFWFSSALQSVKSWFWTHAKVEHTPVISELLGSRKSRRDRNLPGSLSFRQPAMCNIKPHT